MRLSAYAALLVNIAGTAAASPAVENLERLDARIAMAIGTNVAQPIDRRLRLLACAEGVAIEPPAMGAVTVNCASRGWRVRVPLIATSSAEPTEIVIRRGDAVQLGFAGVGFDVTTSATALDDGRTGGVVRVKSSTAVAPVTARVRGPGVVIIGD